MNTETDVVQKLATEFLRVVEDNNPTYENAFAALASILVGLSIQYVHVGLGEVTPENLAEQLTRFQGFTSELALMKMQTINEQLANQKRLEAYADTFKRVTGAED